MALLALETSTEYLSVALAAAGRVFVHDELVGHRHAERVLPVVRDLLSEAGIAFDALQALVFGAGPGAFTGLRIACGVAQGLAVGLDVPIVGVDSFVALAEEARRGRGATRVLAAIDARMQEAYVAALEWHANEWRYVQRPYVAPATAVRAVDGSDWVGCGSAFIAHAEALGGRWNGALAQVLPDARPLAAAMLKAARRRIARGETVDAALAAPLYVRDRVARTVAERRAQAAAVS